MSSLFYNIYIFFIKKETGAHTKYKYEAPGNVGSTAVT
jgi:hypothetical protein